MLPAQLKGLIVLPILFGWSHLPLYGAAVQVKAGNVYYTDSTGRSRQITSSGDSDPALSPDGKRIIFVRTTTTPCGFDEPRDVNPRRTQIWEASLDSRVSPRLIFGGVVQAWSFRYCTFLHPQFALSPRYAYFLIPLAATSDELMKLDIEVGAAMEMTNEEFRGVIVYHVVDSGRYQGDLVVQIKKYFPSGVSQLYWLFDPDGNKLGYVGETEADAQAFLKDPHRQLRKAR